MRWDSTLTKLAVFFAKGSLRAIHGRIDGGRYKELLSGSVAQLLIEHPDINVIRAKSLAAKATGVRPCPEVFSSRRGSAGSNAAASNTRRKSTAAGTRRPTTRKKATRKKVAAKTGHKTALRRSAPR